MGESGRQDVTSVELVGGVEKRDLVLVDHDPGWAVTFRDHRARIDAALGGRARRIEHIGSTAVPGLAAKPIIDILVTVDDIVAEEEYLEPLVAAGYRLRVREPGHRMVRTPEHDVHVHVLRAGDSAADDYPPAARPPAPQRSRPGPLRADETIAGRHGVA